MARSQIVIENPILNVPYDAPARHFRFDDEGRELGTKRNRATSGFPPSTTTAASAVRRFSEVTDPWEAGGMIEAVVSEVGARMPA